MTDWDDLLFSTAELFGGQLPRPETTTVIQAAYERAPHAVERAIQEVAAEFDAGSIRSPWGILKSRVENLHTPDTDRKASAVNERGKAIARAEQWIRVAGVHYDRPSEIEHALFGTAELEATLAKDGQPIVTGGDTLLAAYGDDLHLRRRLVDLWTSERPRGERTEQEAEERAAKYVRQRDEIAAALKLARKLADAGVGNLESPIQTLTEEPKPAVQALLDPDDGIPF